MKINEIATFVEINIIKNFSSQKSLFYIFVIIEFLQLFSDLSNFSFKLNSENVINLKNLFDNNQNNNISIKNNSNSNSTSNYTLSTSDSSRRFLLQYFEYFSISAQMKKFKSCEIIEYNSFANGNKTNLKICSYDKSLFYAVSMVLVFHVFTLCFISYSEKKKITQTNFMAIKHLKRKQNYSKIIKLFNWLINNFFELSLHIMGSFALDLFLNIFLLNFHLSFIIRYANADYFITFFAFVIFLFFICNYLWYVRKINIPFHFSEKIKIPYDNFLSIKYDTCVLLVKIIVSLENNLSLMSITNASMLKFLQVLAYCICLLFMLRIITQIFLGKIIFLINTQINILRVFIFSLFNFLFIGEFLFKSNFTLELLSLVIFSLMIVASFVSAIYFRERNYINIVEENDIVLQFSYLLNFKIQNTEDSASDKAQQKIFMRMVTSHNRSCRLKSCEINNTKQFDLNSIIKAYLKLMEHRSNISHKEYIEDDSIQLKNICLCIVKIINHSNLSRKLIQLFLVIKNPSICRENKKLFIMLQILISEIRADIISTKNNKLNMLNNFGSQANSQTDSNDNLYNTINNNPNSNKNIQRKITNSSFFENEKNATLIVNKKFINFELVLINNSIFIIFKLLCDIIANIVSDLNSKKYDKLFHDCGELQSKQNKIIKFYSVINKHKADHSDFYSLFFIKFIYKKIFNQKLHCEYEINLPSDIKNNLTRHYLNDNFLNLIFKNNKIIIYKASKEYVDYFNKEFKTLFPEFSSNVQSESFEKLIKNSNGNNFEARFLFELRAKNTDLLDFKMLNLHCSIIPSFSLNTLLIIVKCLYIDNEILILEKNPIESITSLKGCSTGISNILSINNNFLKHKSKVSFDFFDLLKENKAKETNNIYDKINKNNTNAQDNIDTISSAANRQTFLLKYKKLRNFFVEFLLDLLKREIITEENYLACLLNFEKRKNKQIFFKIENVETFKTFQLTQKIIQIKLLDISKDQFYQKTESLANSQSKEALEKINNKINHKDPTIRKNSIAVNNINDLNEDFFFENNFKDKINEFVISENSQSLSININKSARFQQHFGSRNNSNINTNNNNSTKNNLLLQQYQNHKIFFKSLITLTIFLIVFGIVLVIIAVNKIEEIKYFYEMNNNFNTLIISYYDTMMSLHQNILLYKSADSSASSGSYPFEYDASGDYYNKFFYSKSVNLSIPQYLNYEIYSKYDSIKDLITEVKGHFFEVGNTDLFKDFSSVKIPNFYVINQNNTIKVNQREILFLEFLDLFLTTAKIVAENPSVYTYISIIDDSQKTFDFKNFNTKNLNYYQINAINLIINFENLVKVFEHFRALLYDLFDYRINFLTQLITYSMIILLFLHQALILIIALFINYFQNTILFNVMMMEHLIRAKDFETFYVKIKHIKQAATLYAEHPRIVIANLKKAGGIAPKRNDLFLSLRNKRKLTSESNTENFKNLKKIESFGNNFNSKQIRVNSIESFKDNNVIATGLNNINNTYINRRTNENNTTYNYFLTREDSTAKSQVNSFNYNSSTNTRQTNNNYFSKNNKNNKIKINRLKKANPWVTTFIKKSKLMTQFKKFTAYSCICFILFFLIFYFSFNKIKQGNMDNNALSKLFFSVFQKLTKNAVLMNTIILLNKTDASLTQSFSLTQANSDHFDYLSSLNNFYNEIHFLQKNTNNNEHKNIVSKFFYDYVYCDLIYSKTYNDKLISMTIPNYAKKNISEEFVNDNLKLICHSFYFIQEKNIFYSLEKLNQLNRYLYNTLLDFDRSYMKLTKLYYSYEVFDFFIFILLVIRPVYSYIQISLITDFMISEFDDYISFIIINLISNFLVEFSFFYLVNKFIIKKALYIDNNMKNAIHILNT